MCEDLISIIVPVYNVEEFLNQCIKSVLGQSYKKLEIILVDDGSTDQSGKICDRYQMTDARIKVIHKENGGLSDARNTGLRLAKGKYYSFIDSDDYISSEMIQTMFDSLKRNQCDIAVCNMMRFGDTVDSVKFYYPAEREQVLAGRERFQTLNQPSVCNKLFCSELFNNIKFPKGKYYEDTYVYHELLYQAKKIVLTGKDSYWYRARPDSIVGRKQYTNQYFDFIEAVYCRARFLESKNVPTIWVRSLFEFICCICKCGEKYRKIGKYKSLFSAVKKRICMGVQKNNETWKNVGMKQKIRLMLLRYFPRIHSKIY